MNAYIFPGQGSQRKGMGADLFDEFYSLSKKADSIVGYSLRTLCLEDPQNNLSNTAYTQPALYTVNILHYLKKLREEEKEPNWLAGHSLGEYSALYAAGVFSFETGLQLVHERGRLMSLAKSNGGMVAVIGLSIQQVKEVLTNPLYHSIDIANYNSYTQIVISGPRSDLEKAESEFKKAGAKAYIMLPVSGAFHSRYMQEASASFAEYLKQFSFNSPRIKILSNVTASAYQFDAIENNLVKQITSMVDWVGITKNLLSYGVKDFLEVGPGDVLTKLTKKIEHGE